MLRMPSPFEFSPSATASSGKPSQTSNGLVSITVLPSAWADLSENELLDMLKTTYNVPDEHIFPLFHRIRLAMATQLPARRRTLLDIRVLSMAVLFSIITEEQAQSRLFPDETRSNPAFGGYSICYKSFDESLQTAAVCAISAIAAYRSKLNDLWRSQHIR
ncbi:hypothetical protein BASA81_018287 [Batrachochytrium salamandrivorans]|nr:hypothetical protein BASA81_018287 [Batrachochytrium salamandrivorans]